MKKIGLIDHYLDNWHAGNLPGWLKNETGGEYKICYGWGNLDPAVAPGPTPTTRSSADWCRAFDVELLGSAAEVVAKSDVLMVLSPNNPEQHEFLCREALASGKRTYVDKTFAPDVAVAKRIFDMAEKGGSPMFSSSALRFTEEMKKVRRDGLRIVNSRGGGPYKIYSIHQIEMLVSLLGPDARRVMALGTESAPALAVEFAGGRYGTMGHYDCPFSLAMAYDGGEAVHIPECTNFFENFVHELVDFFETGAVKAPKAETLAVIGIRETGMKALKTPGVWFDVVK